MRDGHLGKSTNGKEGNYFLLSMKDGPREKIDQWQRRELFSHGHRRKKGSDEDLGVLTISW
jgi:hypothetical protein